jgi:hypothetical protein
MQENQFNIITINGINKGIKKSKIDSLQSSNALSILLDYMVLVFFLRVVKIFWVGEMTQNER